MNQIVQKSYPLSSGQEAMWFIQQIAPESVAYNIFIAGKINSYLDINIVNRVWENIIENHPILRTTYTSNEGKPVQQINQQQKFNIEVIDSSNWSEDHLKEKIFAIADCPFNLEKDAVMRVNLFTLSAKEHILVLTMHHIAGDMWSFDLLLSEFRDLYTIEIAQVSQEHTETANDFLTKNKSYIDFIHWQSEMLSSSRGEKQWQYWQKQLAGELPILNLPTDKPRPPVQTYRGASYIKQLDEQLNQKIRNLALAYGTSPYQILLTAFYVLLYRYTNQQDILVGSPMRGRWGKEFKEIVGYFVNLTVLRVAIEENATFDKLLAQVSKTVREAQKHQDYPFALLIEQVQQQRDRSRPPLCQVSFTWQAQGWCEPKENPLHVQEQVLQMEPYLLGQRGANQDLSLMMREAKGVIEPCWQYNTDLFEATTIKQMARHFETLLEGIVANPKQKISTLPLLTETERYYLKSCGNVVCPSNFFIEFRKQDIEQSITARFQEQVRKYPHNIAVHTKNYHWTYSELNSRANQIAQAILKQCTLRDEKIALLFEHDAPMIAGIMGVLTVGKTYVPLDPNYPSDRVVYILEDSKASAVITNNKNLSRAQELTRGIIPIINIDNITFTSSCIELNLEVSPDTIAYILYTSGSTGQPKGVIQNHRNVLYFIKNYTNNLHINEQDGLTLLSSYSFDAAIMDIFAALLNGASLYPIDVKNEGVTHLLEVLQQQKITIYHSTPTLYRHFVGILDGDEKLNQIRLVVLGGEEVVKTDVDLYKEHFSDECIFVNGLGPTESTICLQYFINKKTVITRNAVPVGYPVEETEILLLNEAGEKTDFLGEIAIRSPHVALGYWQKPNLTQAAFLPDAEMKSRRIYRTGDLGRLRPDGSLEFLGRKDFQVKIRGFRIELGEIETALSQHKYVHSVVVVACEDNTGNKRLVAYLVPQKQVKPTTSELRQFLKARLPDYMIPNAFVILEALPLTPNGKVDRRALPAPDLREGQELSFAAPRTPEEEILAQIWSRVLRLEQVGIHDNFFELGGDSILTIQIITRARQAGLELTTKQLFTHQTIAELAAVADKITETQIEQELVNSSSSETDGCTPEDFPLLQLNQTELDQIFANL
jgi:amino acid adenylation domain-containing protein